MCKSLSSSTYRKSDPFQHTSANRCFGADGLLNTCPHCSPERNSFRKFKTSASTIWCLYGTASYPLLISIGAISSNHCLFTWYLYCRMCCTPLNQPEGLDLPHNQISHTFHLINLFGYPLFSVTHVLTTLIVYKPHLYYVFFFIFAFVPHIWSQLLVFFPSTSPYP